MKTRAQLDACLDQLSAILPVWLEKQRQDAPFWPHFSALAREIVDESGELDRTHVIRRIQAILSAHGKDPAEWKPAPPQ